jgi:hypothetical protein
MILFEQVKAFAEIAPKREQFRLVRMTSCEPLKSACSGPREDPPAPRACCRTKVRTGERRLRR